MKIQKVIMKYFFKNCSCLYYYFRDCYTAIDINVFVIGEVSGCVVARY